MIIIRICELGRIQGRGITFAPPPDYFYLSPRWTKKKCDLSKQNINKAPRSPPKNNCLNLFCPQCDR